MDNDKFVTAQCISSVRTRNKDDHITFEVFKINSSVLYFKLNSGNPQQFIFEVQYSTYIHKNTMLQLETV